MEYIENTLIDFFGSQDMCLGIVSKSGKDRVQVENAVGESHKVQVKQILTQYGPAGKDPLAAFVKIQNMIQEQLDGIDLELLWLTLLEHEDKMPLDAIASEYFGSANPECLSAMARFMMVNHVYFKRTGSEFSARPEEEVEELKRLVKMRAEKAAVRERRRAWLSEVLKHPSGEEAEPMPVPGEMQDMVRRIRDFLTCGFNSDVVNLLPDLNRRLTIREIALLILKNTGSLPEDADEFLLVNGIHAGFTQEVLDAVEQLRPLTEDQLASRENWQNAEAFSVDDESTREIDDALSIQKGEDGTWIAGIHLADPGCYVEKDDILDKVAVDRPLSLYLPTTTVTMFPSALGCSLASLEEKNLRPALSFKVVIREETGEILDWSLAPSAVVIAHRLTYDEADRMIAAPQSEFERGMQMLHRLAGRLEAARTEQGAISLNRPEMKIQVRKGNITVAEENQNTPSHNMVSEWMILANHLAAKYALRNDIPIIYRVQDKPSEPVRSVIDYDPIVFDQEVRKMKRTRLSTYPQPHFGLGLDIYTQVSSPLRRYADLVLHRQLNAHFYGRPLPYSQEELFGVLDNVEKTAMQNRMHERTARKFWLMEYLRREWLDREIDATIVRVEGSLVLAEIDRFYERGVVLTREKFKIGDRIRACINEVNPKLSRMSMKLIARL